MTSPRRHSISGLLASTAVGAGTTSTRRHGISGLLTSTAVGGTGPTSTRRNGISGLFTLVGVRGIGPAAPRTTPRSALPGTALPGLVFLLFCVPFRLGGIPTVVVDKHGRVLGAIVPQVNVSIGLAIICMLLPVGDPAEATTMSMMPNKLLSVPQVGHVPRASGDITGSRVPNLHRTSAAPSTPVPVAWWHIRPHLVR